MTEAKENHAHVFPTGLQLINQMIYDPLNWAMESFQFDTESKAYDACTFLLNDARIIYRKAKVTPTKVGQFVTLWKRKGKEVIQPYDELDKVDFAIVDVSTATYSGHFIFPKSVLIDQGVISTKLKEGKRAIRIYPSWDSPTSSLALKTQRWQAVYFFDMNHLTPAALEEIREMYPRDGLISN